MNRDDIKRRYDDLVQEVVSAINQYTGDKVVNLDTGERAVEHYGDLVIIGKFGNDTPVVRSQSDQRTLELLIKLQSKGETYTGDLDGFVLGYGGKFECENDTPINELLSLEDIIELLDDLYED